MQAVSRFMVVILAVLTMALGPILPAAHAQEKAPVVNIYYSSGCADCGVYIASQLLPVLKEYGYTDVRIYDIWSDRSLAAEMIQRMDARSIPNDLRGHMVAFIGDRITLQDHLVPSVVRSVLQAAKEDRLPERLSLNASQDMGNMHGRANVYTVWDHEGQARNYPINASIDRFLTDRQQDIEKQAAASAAADALRAQDKPMFGLIISSGLLDGLNPCAFAALLFFTAFLFAARKARGQIRKLAATYVVTSLVVYFLIGLGAIGSVSMLTQGHLVSKLAAAFTIGLGVLGIIRWAFPGAKVPTMGMSGKQWNRAKGYLMKATIPATIVAAFLVTLCTLPCSGFMYFSILALLAAETTRAQGLGYLVLYNLAFIIPLVVVALAVTNRHTARAMAQLERKHHRITHLVSSIAMIVLGVIILLWMM